MALNTDLLQKSFRRVTPIGKQFVKDFYDNFFTIAPDVVPLFPADMSEQRHKLLISLMTIFKSIDNEEELRPYLEYLGQKHKEYGVAGGHYPQLAQALLKTLAETLGDEWTPEMAEAWGGAYEYIASVMRAE